MNQIKPKTICEIVKKFIDKPWDWGQRLISNNKNITMEFVEKYSCIDKPWNWNCFSRNLFITMEFVQKFIYKPWI